MDFDVWRQWQTFAALGAPQPLPPSAQSGFAPFIDAAARFAAAARAFAEGSRNATLPGAAAMAAQQFGNFLRDQFADSFKPPWLTKPAHCVDFAVAADAPALGLTREHQERAQRAADAGRRMADAQQRLTRLWSDTLREAAVVFAQRLSTASASPPSNEELNRLYDAWVDCAEEAYARTAHSDPFCEALADYVNAGSSWRRESNAAVEQWAKLLDLPTRNEINTLAQRLRDVEAELRSLRKSADRPQAREAASARVRRPGRKAKTP